MSTKGSIFPLRDGQTSHQVQASAFLKAKEEQFSYAGACHAYAAHNTHYSFTLPCTSKKAEVCASSIFQVVGLEPCNPFSVLI